MWPRKFDSEWVEKSVPAGTLFLKETANAEKND
jgi:hypothetical protein